MQHSLYTSLKIIFFFHAAPLLKDLYKHVTPEYATSWREIGIHLGLSDAKMRIIKADHPKDVKGCCNEMLAKWLAVDLNASWKKLFVAIDSSIDSGHQTIKHQGML